MKCICDIKLLRNLNSSIITECIGFASVSGDEMIKVM